MFALAVLMPFVPSLIGQRKLKNDMLLFGSNSMVLSAACHASTVDAPKPEYQRDEDRDVELQNSTIDHLSGQKSPQPDESFLLSPQTTLSVGDDLDTRNRLRQLSRVKLKWGVVRMPAEFYTRFGDSNQPIEHLAFGCEEQDVGPPEAGVLYA
jgi:hypothetical protein